MKNKKEQLDGNAKEALEQVSKILPGLGNLVKNIEKLKGVQDKMEGGNTQFSEDGKTVVHTECGSTIPPGGSIPRGKKVKRQNIRVDRGFNIGTCGSKDDEQSSAWKPKGYKKSKGVSKDTTPVVVERRKPVVDVFEEKGCLQIIVEASGLTEEDMSVSIKEDLFSLEITSPHWAPSTTTKLPYAPKGKITKTFENGILKVRIGKGRKS